MLCYSSTIKGHIGWVTSVAFAPDGGYLATGSRDKTAKLWEVNTGRLVRTFKGHTKAVASVAFAPDGIYLATGSRDKTAKLWEVNTGRLIRTIKGHIGWVTSVAFAPDGIYLATGSRYNTAKLWPLWQIPDNKIKLLVAEKEDQLKLIENELQAELRERSAPQGEFETTRQYQQRLQAAESRKAALNALYRQKIERLEREYDNQIRAEIAGSRQAAVLANTAVIGRYDLDRQLFPIEYQGESYEIKVPVSNAPDFKQRFNAFKIEGEQQLNEQGGWEYFNLALVEPESGRRYPFGEQRGQSPVIAAPAPALPPRLRASIAFTEPSGNGFLDAGEQGALTVEISNFGEGNAVNIITEIQSVQKLDAIVIENLKTIPVLKPGDKQMLTFSFTATDDLPTDVYTFDLKFSEANGFEPDPLRITIETRALAPPDVVIAELAVQDQSGNGKIEPAEITTITVRLFNQGSGATRSSRALIQPGANVFLAAESTAEFALGNISAGGFKDIEFTIYTNKRVRDKIPISIYLDDDRPKFRKTMPLDLRINVSPNTVRELVFKGVEKSAAPSAAPRISIDIEKDIPQLSNSNPDAVAVVIGNRDYSRAKNVEFALRDAEYVKDYLIKMLGYKEGNIFLVTNATNADFLTYFGSADNPRGKLADLVKSGKSDVFVYYSGHGAPGLKTHKGYFVPVDSDPNRIELTGYPLEVFYKNLAQIPAKSLTVVIDACFSGTNIYENISPIVIEMEAPEMMLENAVVLSSAGGRQVSAWYNEKFHSLFTYFFLKGLHSRDADLNGDGQITYRELYRYLSDRNEGVPYWARRLHGTEQLPIIQGDNQDGVFIRY